MVKGNNLMGKGYFNKQNNFIIEYKNKKSGKKEYATFKTFKM